MCAATGPNRRHWGINRPLRAYCKPLRKSGRSSGQEREASYKTEYEMEN